MKDHGSPQPPQAQAEPLNRGLSSTSPAIAPGIPGLRGSRADIRSGGQTVVLLAVLGLGAGLLWLWLAPRAQFTVTSTGGDVEVTGGGLVDPELFMGDDGVFVLLLGGLGLLAGLIGWTRVRRRGVVTLVALGAGMLAASLTAWQLGALLGRGPSRADLTTVGREVTTALDLNMLASLAIGPFAAVLVYLVATVLTGRDDLGRDDHLPGPVPAPAGGPGPQPWAPPGAGTGSRSADHPRPTAEGHLGPAVPE